MLSLLIFETRARVRLTWYTALWCAAAAPRALLAAPPALVTPPALITPPPCPQYCICLSQSQVVCNSPNLQGVPAELPGGITQLSVARADLRVLRSDAFSNMRALRLVTLDACNLTVVRPFAFRNLPRLREIHIRQTPLSVVHAFAFAGLQNLTTLDLSHNRIAVVEGSAFAGTIFLRLLALDHNPLRRIAARAFAGLTEVERVLLPSGIRVIEPLAFAGLEGVGSLELAYMDLDALKPDTFRGLARVRSLSLRDSDLGAVQSGAFDGLGGVDTLDVCNNKIDALEELWIPANSSVRVLRLTGNHVLESPGEGAVLLEVEVVVARGNHWPCECGARNVLHTELAVAPNFSSENYCISPLKMRGRQLRSAAGIACRDSSDTSGARTAASLATHPPYAHTALLAFAALLAKLL